MNTRRKHGEQNRKKKRSKSRTRKSGSSVSNDGNVMTHTKTDGEEELYPNEVDETDGEEELYSNEVDETDGEEQLYSNEVDETDREVELYSNEVDETDGEEQLYSNEFDETDGEEELYSNEFDETDGEEELYSNEVDEELYSNEVDETNGEEKLYSNEFDETDGEEELYSNEVDETDGEEKLYSNEFDETDGEEELYSNEVNEELYANEVDETDGEEQLYSNEVDETDGEEELYSNEVDATDGEEELYLNEVDEDAPGRKIGKLVVSNKVIARGSHGTVVLEGIYEGREVAVKQLLRGYHDVTSKEIQNLIVSDNHPNIVRLYGVESNQDFTFLVLERCSCSLDDLIGKDNMQGLLKANGCPTPPLLKLMRDIVHGLSHLHELGIRHRDLKPQNILIIKERSLRAKLSNMGISKRLLGDKSSLGDNATGCGSSGWQAPEVLAQGRQTRAADLFSLGCVLFFCITGGKHPFGECNDRDGNIERNQKDLLLIEYFPEAEDLISHLLDPNPGQRPKACEVLHHPFFWSSEMRLSFLRDASDRVELKNRKSNSNLSKALKDCAPVAFGGRWDQKLESAFITDIRRCRRYKFNSVRDLLRVIRNKLNHFRESPLEIQELVGPVPDGFDEYFASRYPRLLIEVYKILFQHCKEDGCFQRYFKNVD